MNVEESKIIRNSFQPSPVEVLVDEKLPENVEYFNYLSNMTAKNAIMQKQHSEEEKSFHQQIVLKYKEETSKVLHLEHSFVWC